MQDATKVAMGSVGMSGYNAENFAADPADFPAGIACRLKSDGTISKTLADGSLIGVSRGKSGSATKKLSVVTDGRLVPMQVEAGPARGVVTITSYANLVATSNDTLKIGATTFTFKASPSTESEVGAVTNNNTTAANLASKINNHSVAGTLFKAVAVGAVVTITALDNDTEGADIDLVYTDVHGSDIGLTVDDVTFTGGGGDSDFIVLGAKVYISNTSGKADDPNSDATISDAIYASGLLTGIAEDGSEVPCVLVDMPGGL